LSLAAAGVAAQGSSAAAAPQGQLTYGVHVSLAPSWFDPGEAATISPYMLIYALHDALLKAMPGPQSGD
jgi:peptide/nickel transport system substrate-binding protein